MAFYCRRFLFRMMLYFLLETLSHAVGNPSHQVKGILGGSVLFPANVSQGISVEKIEWDFRPQMRGLGYWLGEFRHSKLERSGPTDRFGQRLDVVKGTTLRLKDLELDDGGIYNARIWFTKTQFQEQSFSLTVYEPVPTPQIHHQVESKTPGGCNVTLQCHTPGREELKVSWETGDPLSTLRKSVNQYQVSDNGRELHVFFWNSSFNSNFTCLVSNPVDQKRASFDLLSICQSDEGGKFGHSSLWLIAVCIVLLVIIVVIWMCWKRRFRKHRRGGRGIHSLTRLEKGESTLTFWNSERSHPEDDDDEVDSDREDFSSSSTQPRESFPSLNSYAVSDTEPSEIEHCIPQTNLGDQAHLLEPLQRNSLSVPQGKDPLKISHCCQLIRSYSLPSLPSSFKHSSQESRDQAKEQHTKTYPVIMEGVSLRARSPRNAFMKGTNKSV